MPGDTPEVTWKLTNFPTGDLGHTVSGWVAKLAKEHVPDLADMFPFECCEASAHFDAGWFAVKVTDVPGGSYNTASKLKPAEVDEVRAKLSVSGAYSHADLVSLLGSDWFSAGRFSYVGPYRDGMVSWPDILTHIIDWLNSTVLPDVLRRNEARVRRAIPMPPQFNIAAIREALWVLECNSTFRQGTAFNLQGVGLITCQHVLGNNTVAWRPGSSAAPQPVQLIAQNESIDLAVLSVDRLDGQALERGSADQLHEFDHLLVAGFPNYRHGDTGTVVPGLVVGFRPVSGIRRILTNAPIVAGASGGPVLGAVSLVVGVAVTGADRMENAERTEDHGVVPIDALTYLGR